MAIQYPGGTTVNSLWTQSTGTRGELVTKIETDMNSAGWTTISGGGTGDVLLESAQTPQGLKCRVRLYDPGTGNCAQLFLKNLSGTLTSQAYFLLPAAAKQWRLVVNKYQAFIWTPGATVAREFVAFGVVWIPSSLQSPPSLISAWIHGNGVSDTSTTLLPSFRTALAMGGLNTNNTTRDSQIVDTYLLDIINGSGNSVPGLYAVYSGRKVDAFYQWSDGALVMSDPAIGFGVTAWTEYAFLRGLLWGAVVLGGALAGDSTYTFDGHNWIAVTNQNAGSTYTIAGTLLLATN